MFQPCGYGADIAASAKVLSLKSLKFPFGTSILAAGFMWESGKALGSSFLLYENRNLWPEGQLGKKL